MRIVLWGLRLRLRLQRLKKNSKSMPPTPTHIHAPYMGHDHQHLLVSGCWLAGVPGLARTKRAKRAKKRRRFYGFIFPTPARALLAISVGKVASPCHPLIEEALSPYTLLEAKSISSAKITKKKHNYGKEYEILPLLDADCRLPANGNKVRKM